MNHRETGKNLIMVVVAGLGFLTLDLGKKDQPWRGILAGITTNIEFLIALAGFSSALFDLAWDLTHGGE